MSNTLNRRHFMAAALALPALTHGAASQTADTNEDTPMLQKIRLRFADQTFAATLNETEAARDFLSMLPLDLTIEDYSTNEKIAYLPRKLTEAGAGPFGNEAPGDPCYFMPWGNLAMFFGSYRYSSGLLRLGRLDDGPAPLLTPGTFPLSISAQS